MVKKIKQVLPDFHYQKVSELSRVEKVKLALKTKALFIENKLSDIQTTSLGELEMLMTFEQPGNVSDIMVKTVIRVLGSEE